MKKNTSIGIVDFLIAGALAGGSMLAFSFIGPKGGGAAMPENAIGENALDLETDKGGGTNNGGNGIVNKIKAKAKEVINSIQWSRAEFPLQQGMQGKPVAEMQLLLNKIEKKSGSTDGKFGPNTEAQLKRLGFAPRVTQIDFEWIKQKANPDPKRQLAGESKAAYLKRMGFSQVSIDVAISIRQSLQGLKNDVMRENYLAKLFKPMGNRSITNILRCYKGLFGQALTDQMARFSPKSTTLIRLKSLV